MEDCSPVQRIVVVSHDSFLLPSQGKVTFIQQPNRGYAAGLNRAIGELANSGIRTVLAANPDVIINCKIVEELHAAHLASGAACTFPVLSERGRLLEGYRFSRLGTLLRTPDAEWYSGACFLVSMEAWKKVGGLDESFFHYFEDRDFCIRVRRAGLTLHQARRVVVQHETKSGQNFVEGPLPKYAIKNHLLSLERSSLLSPASFANAVIRNFLYLFRWKQGWRGIPQWISGVQEFLTRDRS